MHSNLPIALTLDELQKECEADETINKVIKSIQTNRWGKAKQLRPCRQIKNELTVKDCMILKGNKLIIPAALQKRVLKDLGQFPIQSAQILTACGLDNA